MKLLFTYLTFFAFIASFAQGEITLSTIDQIPLKADRFIAVDSYGALYYTQNQTLFKTFKETTHQYQNFQLGKISHVDILNPLKITVFFADYQTAILLDNKLNLVEKISFALEPPFLNVMHATTANDNRLWTFNEDTQQLELYNYRDKSNQTLSRPIAENYSMHLSNFNFCYVITDKNIRLFNIYGSVLNSIPMFGIQKAAMVNDQFLVLKNNILHLYTENLTKETVLKSIEFPIKDLYLSDDFLYIYDGELIHKMKLTQTKK